MLINAYNALQSATAEKNNRDGCTIYGEYIADKLRSYDIRTRSIVQHYCNNIIFEADMGNYSQHLVQRQIATPLQSPVSYSSTPTPPVSIVQSCDGSSLDASTQIIMHGSAQPQSATYPQCSTSTSVDDLGNNDINADIEENNLVSYINTFK